MENFNVMDTIYTLIVLIINIGILVLIMLFIRTFIENTKRAKRIEKKLDELIHKIENNQS